MAIEVLYFARVREAIGKDREAVDAHVSSIDHLLGHLVARGDGYAGALADRSRLRFAINQRMAAAGDAITDGDEVAIFPPVTGG